MELGFVVKKDLKFKKVKLPPFLNVEVGLFCKSSPQNNPHLCFFFSIHSTHKMSQLVESMSPQNVKVKSFGGRTSTSADKIWFHHHFSSPSPHTVSAGSVIQTRTVFVYSSQQQRGVLEQEKTETQFLRSSSLRLFREASKHIVYFRGGDRLKISYVTFPLLSPEVIINVILSLIEFHSFQYVPAKPTSLKWCEMSGSDIVSLAEIHP